MLFPIIRQDSLSVHYAAIPNQGWPLFYAVNLLDGLPNAPYGSISNRKNWPTMISYSDSTSGIEPAMLAGFFVGWPKPPTPETHLKILKQSYMIELAIDSETEEIVGFVNAISDGILAAYLPLLEVLPAYQKRGIGRELIERILSRLDGLYMIDLTCDADLQSMYQKLGFQEMTAMMIRNFDHQSGRE
ncbi:MAG: GNAT family N-acetyltransferase [candidate division Zixibacteria bacterium]